MSHLISNVGSMIRHPIATVQGQSSQSNHYQNQGQGQPNQYQNQQQYPNLPQQQYNQVQQYQQPQSQSQPQQPPSNQMQQYNPHNPQQPQPQYTPQYSNGLGRPRSMPVLSRDEYEPLAKGAEMVDRGLKGDDEISVDLAGLLSRGTIQGVQPYVRMPRNDELKAFQEVKNLPMPDGLIQELNDKELTAKMGLFEEIERAWITVGNKLFFWDYGDGKAFARYDEQQETIQSVGLVKAKKDVFVDTITHILLITTSSRLTIFGISYTSSKPRELNLYNTNLTSELYTNMTDIRGTDDGRVFMLGHDKEMYEVTYSNAEGGWGGWFAGGGKVKVGGLSAGRLASMLPGVLGSSGKDGVEKFVVDAQQNRLYTLRTNGALDFFDVAGSKWEFKGRIEEKGYDGGASQTRVNDKDPKERYTGFQIVSLNVVGLNESKTVNLVAITKNGSRLYFTFQTSYQRPELVNKRQLQMTGASPHSFYSSSVTLISARDTSTPTPQTRLWLHTPNSGYQTAQRENSDDLSPPILQEWYQENQQGSEVWAIAEVYTTDPKLDAPLLRTEGGISLSPVARQGSVEGRSFLVLSTTGLLVLGLKRPLDMVVEDLIPESTRKEAIYRMKSTFGKLQFTAMALLWGSGDQSGSQDIQSIVKSIINDAGSPENKTINSAANIVYSARHDALAQTLARCVRGVWTANVVVYTPNGYLLGAGEARLMETRARLQSLDRFLLEYEFPRAQGDGGQNPEVWGFEEYSIIGLKRLIKQAIEAIAFILLLRDHQLSLVIARSSQTTQEGIRSMKFRDFFTTQKAREVARGLVTVLIELQIGQEAGIDALSAKLREQCGSFVTPGDIDQYKAEESLRKAENTRDAYERTESLGQALRLFTQAGEALGNSTQQLQQVSRRFRALGYTPAAIELPLSCAAALDPSDKALDFVRDGRHPGDPRGKLYEQRRQCYELVTEALGEFDENLDKAVASGSEAGAAGKRDEAYRYAIASDDELFHFHLYDWHVERGLQEHLLEFDTPYIEPYLQLTQNDVPDRRDLLWKFYARRGDYLRAAHSLYDLATRPGGINLNDRTYYLAQSLASAKSASSVGADDVEFVQRIQDGMDVATIQGEVLGAVRVIEGLEEREKVLQRLDGVLLDLDQLFGDFAAPLRLYRPILSILKAANQRLEDMCEAVWRQLLQGCVQGAEAGLVVQRLSEEVGELVKRYYPSEAAPLDVVLPVVYDVGMGVARGGDEGLVTRGLIDGGVPLRDVWEGLMGLYEAAESEEQRGFYDEEVGVVVERWVSERDSIPAAEVERFVSAYLLRMQVAGGDDRRERTRERMRKAKDAAGRW